MAVPALVFFGAGKKSQNGEVDGAERPGYKIIAAVSEKINHKKSHSHQRSDIDQDLPKSFVKFKKRLHIVIGILSVKKLFGKRGLIFLAGLWYR